MPEWIQNIDDHVLQWFQDHHTPWLDYNFQQLTAIGTTTILMLLALFASGLLAMERQCMKAFLVPILLLGAYYATDAIKDAVARPRPKVGQPPKALSSSYSFPSGHSSLSMTGFLLVALSLKEFWRRSGRRGMYPFAVGWAVGMAALVGASRLYFGYHFLSDVMGGWLLGILFALVFLAITRLTSRGATVPAESAPAPQVGD